MYYFSQEILRIHYRSLTAHLCVISSHAKQPRTMSQSTDDTIQPTQSVEVVMETETQDELPDTQQSVCDYDIFYPDDMAESVWGVSLKNNNSKKYFLK